MKIVDTAERIIDLLAGGVPLSGQEIANRLGLTRQAINRHMQRLARAGRIAKSGRTKNAHYLLVWPGDESPSDDARDASAAAAASKVSAMIDHTRRSEERG